MNEYINLTLENIDEEHICCAIGDKKHQAGVDSKKEWIKSKLKDGHIFRKLNARGKIFIEYEPIETAWIPISGKNYEYIYCLWVAGSFKGKGIGKELIEYAINDSKEKGKSGICTLVSKKKKPFIGEKKFFEHYGFKVVDSIADYELLALQFEDGETPKFNDNARTMKIDNQDLSVRLSKNKIDKYFNKIKMSFQHFEKKKVHNRKDAFKLLSARINYLTSNTKLRNNKDKVFVGIYYSNPFLNSDVSLEKLQTRLKWSIDRAGFTNNEKQIMLKYSFIDGFKKKTFQILPLKNKKYKSYNKKRNDVNNQNNKGILQFGIAEINSIWKR